MNKIFILDALKDIANFAGENGLIGSKENILNTIAVVSEEISQKRSIGELRLETNSNMSPMKCLTCNL